MFEVLFVNIDTKKQIQIYKIHPETSTQARKTVSTAISSSEIILKCNKRQHGYKTFWKRFSPETGWRKKKFQGNKYLEKDSPPKNSRIHKKVHQYLLPEGGRGRIYNESEPGIDDECNIKHR